MDGCIVFDKREILYEGSILGAETAVGGKMGIEMGPDTCHVMSVHVDKIYSRKHYPPSDCRST